MRMVGMKECIKERRNDMRILDAWLYENNQERVGYIPIK